MLILLIISICIASQQKVYILTNTNELEIFVQVVLAVLATYTIIASLRVYYIAKQFDEIGACLCTVVFGATGIAAGCVFFYIYQKMFYPTFFLETMPKFSAYCVVVIMFMTAFSYGLSKPVESNNKNA
jgi:hypothetical protein